MTPQLSTVIGAVYTDAEVGGASMSSRLIGSQPVNVPEWRAVANLNYELTSHFTLDVGVEYVGRRAARSLHNAGTTQQLQLRDPLRKRLASARFDRCLQPPSAPGLGRHAHSKPHQDRSHQPALNQ